MTRAKERLYLVRAFRRSFGGPTIASRFLKDIPPHLVAGRPVVEAVAVTSRGDLKVAATSPSMAPAFAPGDRVHHASFGEGVVVSCRVDSGDQMVTVAFKGEAGVKKLLLSMAPLERKR